MPSLFTYKTVTIPSSGTTSDAVDVEGLELVAVQMPAAFTGIALTLEGNVDGGSTFISVTDAGGTAVSLTVAANKLLLLDPSKGRVVGLAKLRVVSGSAEAAERQIKLAFVKAV